MWFTIIFASCQSLAVPTILISSLYSVTSWEEGKEKKKTAEANHDQLCPIANRLVYDGRLEWWEMGERPSRHDVQLPRPSRTIAAPLALGSKVWRSSWRRHFGSCGSWCFCYGLTRDSFGSVWMQSSQQLDQPEAADVHPPATWWFPEGAAIGHLSATPWLPALPRNHDDLLSLFKNERK